MIALSIAALAAVPNLVRYWEPEQSISYHGAAPSDSVRVELRSGPPSLPTPKVVPQPPPEVRCCACAMARNEELWREQQARDRATKRKRR